MSLPAGAQVRIRVEVTPISVYSAHRFHRGDNAGDRSDPRDEQDRDQTDDIFAGAERCGFGRPGAIEPAAGGAGFARGTRAACRNGLVGRGLLPWAVGYFPWIASGVSSLLTLPRRAGGRGFGGERLAVPLTVSSMWLLVLGAQVGGVLAGMLGLVARPGHRRTTALATLTGVGLAVMVAGAQAVAASGTGSAYPSEDPRARAGLCMVLALTALGGWAFGACAPLGRPGTGLALAVLAGATPLWLSTSVTQLLGTSSTGRLGTDGVTMAWVSGAVLAVALAVIGVRPPSRLIWWPVALVVAWTVTPALTAVVYLQPLLRAGSRVPRVLSNAIQGTAHVLTSAAAPGARSLTPWVAAIVIGAALALVVPRLRPPCVTQPSAAELEPAPQMGRFIISVFLWIITVGSAAFGAAGMVLALWSGTFDDGPANSYPGYGVAIGTLAATVGGVVSLCGIVGLRQRHLADS